MRTSSGNPSASRRRVLVDGTRGDGLIVCNTGARLLCASLEAKSYKPIRQVRGAQSDGWVVAIATAVAAMAAALVLSLPPWSLTLRLALGAVAFLVTGFFSALGIAISPWFIAHQVVAQCVRAA